MSSDKFAATGGHRDTFVGRVLDGRYAVERLVGTGGMGTVYAARQAGLDRVVAVKILKPELSTDGVEAERFRREALATARLRHPNIVKVFDFGRTEDGRVYLVMELLGGPTLRQWLDANPYPDPAEVVGIFEPVCAAIDAMHRAGIVHRDVKPGNIAMPDPADPNDVVKVIDLGIVRFADVARSDLTGNFVVGTAAYISPEVAYGHKAEATSDVYSLGVAMFEALTGDLPFWGESAREFLVKHATAQPPIPSSIRTSLPKALDAVLLRALEKEPAKRFATARELAAAARAALSGTPNEAALSPKVLLVAPEGVERDAAVAELSAAGYDVSVVADGVEALLRLGGATFECVVADAALTNLGGAALLGLLPAKGIRVPAVLLGPFTAAGAPAATAVLEKPLPAGALAAAVARAISNPTNVGGNDE